MDPHSNDFWAQSNVTLKNADKLTSLTVELKIRQTGGVSDTGSWRSAPESDFTTTVTEKDGFLVYTWVLKDGHTLAVEPVGLRGPVQPHPRRPGRQGRPLLGGREERGQDTVGCG